MNWKLYTLNICFLLTSITAFSQIDKVKYPYYSSKLFFQNGMELKGIILKTNDASFYLIQRKEWRKIKGEYRNLGELQRVLIKKGVTEWPQVEITYRGLESIELRKQKRPSNARWVGLGIGFAFGALVTSWANSIGCGDDNPDGICKPNEGVLRNGLIMGGIGFGLGSIFSIRVPKRLMVEEKEDKEWQQSLLQYSVLR